MEKETIMPPAQEQRNDFRGNKRNGRSCTREERQKFTRLKQLTLVLFCFSPFRCSIRDERREEKKRRTSAKAPTDWPTIG